MFDFFPRAFLFFSVCLRVWHSRGHDGPRTVSFGKGVRGQPTNRKAPRFLYKQFLVPIRCWLPDTFINCRTGYLLAADCSPPADFSGRDCEKRQKTEIQKQKRNNLELVEDTLNSAAGPARSRKSPQLIANASVGVVAFRPPEDAHHAVSLRAMDEPGRTTSKHLSLRFSLFLAFPFSYLVVYLTYFLRLLFFRLFYCVSFWRFLFSMSDEMRLHRRRQVLLAAAPVLAGFHRFIQPNRAGASPLGAFQTPNNPISRDFVLLFSPCVCRQLWRNKTVRQSPKRDRFSLARCLMLSAQALFHRQRPAAIGSRMLVGYARSEAAGLRPLSARRLIGMPVDQ